MATLEKPRQKKKRAVPSVLVKNKEESDTSKKITEEVASNSKDVKINQDVKKVLSELPSTSREDDNVPVEQTLEVTVEKVVEEVGECATDLKLVVEEVMSIASSSNCDTENSISEVTKEHQEATAPVIDEPETQEIVAYPKLPVQECSKTIEPVILPSVIALEHIKPYTISQLGALYYNQELAVAKSFEVQLIEQELAAVSAKQHTLYDLITRYIRARDKLKENSLELAQLQTECASLQDQIWNLEHAKVSGKAHCQDGAPVFVTHCYLTATLQRPVLESLARTQLSIKKLANEAYTLHAYTCASLQMKIENYLGEIMTSCKMNNSSVVLQEPNFSNQEQLQVAFRELRICISVLFFFQRQLHKDKELVAETRAWLADCVAVLLRAADWQDHIYLLVQVLRCPAGVGHWAAPFVQVPSPVFLSLGRPNNDSPFANRFVNHIVTILSVILSPISKRDAFLEQMWNSLLLPEGRDAVAENLWVLVDSDGEEDEPTDCGAFALKENDLVAFLNQIPIDDLFRTVLLINKKDNKDIYMAENVTEHHMLRLLAFSTVLISLIDKGLATYHVARYRQFAKRLCRLIRHCLQYVSDAWEAFKLQNKIADAAMLHRLQTEFDAFFLRTTSCLFQAQSLGAWQFLAVAPFHTVSLHVLWRFFYILHQGRNELDSWENVVENITAEYIHFKSKLSEGSIRQQFCERLLEMSVEESYYLLNTFANMIMARPAEDVEFIQFATLNLLQIGFSGVESQESCRRCAAILLSNITSKYPYLISDILSFIRNNINDLEQLPFLFSELPLWLWYPAETDLIILRGLLLQNPLTSIESYLARKILCNLNWDFCRPGQLFLPLKMHREVAVLVGEAMYKFGSNADSATFLDGVKQAVGPATLTPEQNLARWSWQLVYQLRLHASDRDTASVQGVSELVAVDVLQSGVREQQPLACFLALQMTSVGHLLPVVCSQGLEQLEILAGNYKHDAVLISLFNIVPLFVDCPDNLIMCTSFQNILQNLLNADRTYMKIAKSFISADFPGAVLRHFGNMIQMQTRNPKWRSLIVFWAKSFISLPNWSRDPGVLYLLNLVIRTGFFIPEAIRSLELVFNELLEKAMVNAATNSSLLSWVPLVGTSSSSGSALLLQGPNGGAAEPWLIFLVISLEHQQVEVKTGLWAELLKQLFATSGKTNIDQSLKKAANALKIPSYASGGLCIYRWAQVAVDTDLNHPLLPLVWQKFFSLYLARVPGPENRGSVGSKFFDGMVNTSFSKKLKKRLQETVDFYNNILEPPSSEDQIPENISQISREIYHRCSAVFKAYILWLEEPLLQEATLYLPSLPPQYEPRYLAAIVQNSTSPWMELINCEKIRASYEKSQTEWFNMCNRIPKRRPIQKMSGSELKDPIERILRRLTSYDKPLPAPPLKNKSSVIPMITIPNPQSVISVLQPYIKRLQQYAEIYSLQLSEHGALDGQYKELVQQLYSNFQTKTSFKKTCKGMCEGAGIITLTFCEARANESIKHQLQTNRTNFSSLLTRSVLPPANNLCINCCTIEDIAALLHTNLFESINRRDHNQESQLRDIGVEFFYYLFSTLSDELKKFPPTHQVFQASLENLGHAFLLGVESESIRLCKAIFNDPKKASLLTPHFIAVNLGTITFLQLYSEICDKIQDLPVISLALLSKFDIYNWLTTKNPRLVDRTKFIHLIFQSLTKLGPKTNQVALQETFRRHLLAIFRFDFPEHYGEVLMQALQCSGQQTLPLAVWLDLLNALSHPVAVDFGSDVLSKQEILQLRRHATEQKMLHHRELDGTVTLLAKYFAQERLQFGLYGLYPKYRPYGNAICLLLGQTLHAFIVSTLNARSGDLGEHLLAEHLWPRLLDAFAPWLIPYSVKDCKDNTATWIQQLTDDRSVLLPWIQADISHAQKMFHMFINCIAFIGETLPACNNLLCYVWQFYATHFTHAAIKEHIYTVVHSSLLLINWERFWPSLTDLEIMLKVVDTYLPECHAFVGHVFLEVNWNSWLARLVQQTTDLVPSSRVHHCLLHLLVKLSSEQSVRQNDKARLLLERAREFSTWHVLEVQALEHALDWYVMSCDPRVVLHEASAVKLIDYQVFGLLRVVSCYDNTSIVLGDQLSVTKKRQCFLRAFIKLLVNCSSRHKSLLSNQAVQFEGALINQLNHMENIINNSLLKCQVLESDLLVAELLAIFNNTSLNPIALACFTQWIEKRSFNSVVLCSVLRIAGNVVTSAECLSSLLECSCTAYFSDDIQSVADEQPNWSCVVRLLNMGPPKQPPLETILISNGRILTLYAVLLKKIGLLIDGDRNSVEVLLESVVNWLIQIKANDMMEPKLPLLWREVIKLSLKVCHLGGEDKVANILRKFVYSHLLPVSESKGGGTGSGWGRGLLGAIGLMKQGSVSVPFRFLCKSLAGYLLAQLPEIRGESTTVRCFAGASCPVGQPGGNVDCAKVLLKLDAGVGTAELKSYVEMALKQIQDPQNSLHSAEQFLFGLVNLLYSKTYLRRF